MVILKTDIAVILTIKGLVQGVGFRPFIFRLANECVLNGWVKNTNHAVVVHLEGEEENITLFKDKLKTELPPAASIHSVEYQYIIPTGVKSFFIEKSTSDSEEITAVSPDIAVCSECLEDMKLQPFRKNYPLINCCNCGPRFSIVQSLPYDRANTTMAHFEMCPDCAKEYNNPIDRRFHAQPVACNNCGPVYSLTYKENGNISQLTDIHEIINYLKISIQQGEIIAFKGTGGFNLVCDAQNEEAVFKLRQIKHRDTKPFAVMFRNIEAIQQYAHVSEEESSTLQSFRRPIVILDEKKALASSVCLGLDTLGAMLPYMPFHYLLFQHLEIDCLVMTSGNISDEPIIIDNDAALVGFIDITKGVLSYNRAIHNRLDDSVIRIMNNKPRIIRRSRGFVPENIQLNVETEGIAASGAELTGAFTIGKDDSAIISQYIGDLQHVENFNFYTESFDRFQKLFRFQGCMFAHDAHPDYLSTRFAQNSGIETISVQHHFAHIASVMAEHNITKPIIGIAFDGTGFGNDGHIWGSEFLLCTPQNFERLAHFEYAPLPGGDKSVLEPWRTAIAQLYHYFGKEIFNQPLPFLQNIEKKKVEMILWALENKINAPLSCSAGRLFDAIAAVSQICINPRFHAEAPMRLEAAIDKSCKHAYSYLIDNKLITFKSMWTELLADIDSHVEKGIIAAKFHNCIINATVDTCVHLKTKHRINSVALSGGTFQNKYLLENIENLLKQNGFEVFTNEKIPSNDGGISLGQLFVAAHIRNNKN